MVEKTDLSRHIVAKAMELAAERGWRNVSLADIAARAEVSLADLHEVVQSKHGILLAYSRSVDHRVLEGLTTFDSDSVRDRLFELLMKRFDALTPDKAALRGVLRDTSTDPLVAVGGLYRLSRSMGLMLEAVGVDVTGVSGALRANGLAAIYANAFRVWLNDDSTDMGRTMAALDKGLRRGESVAGLIWRDARRRRDQPTRGATAERSQPG